jgi:hypothetical protein
MGGVGEIIIRTLCPSIHSWRSFVRQVPISIVGTLALYECTAGGRVAFDNLPAIGLFRIQSIGMVV